MSGNVTRDESMTRTEIDALIEIKTVGFVPDSTKLEITVEKATEIFAIIGKPYNVGGQEYALVDGGEYNDIDLVSMMDWLREANPDMFDALFRAILEVVDEDELDDTGWGGDDDLDDADVCIYLDYDWLLEVLGEEGVDKFIDELGEALDAYLCANGYEDYSSAVIATIDDCVEECCCCCGAEIPASEGLENTEDDDCGDYPWEVVLHEELDTEDMADLETSLEDAFLMPFLQKYGLVSVDIAEADGQATGEQPPEE